MTIADAITEVISGRATLVDVRTNEEYAGGHAKGAKNFDVSLLAEGHDPGYAKDRKLFLYCLSGGRAQHAQMLFERMGYQSVVNLGGLSQWEAAGGETASGAVCDVS
jgi:phage shock protein E